MGISTGTAKALLVTLFTLGYLGMFKNGFGNGFFEQIDGLISAEKPKLPSSNLSLRVRWTGFLKLDRLLATILAFFSPIFDGQFPSLKVVGLHFYGQFIPSKLQNSLLCLMHAAYLHCSLDAHASRRFTGWERMEVRLIVSHILSSRDILL